MLSEIIHLTPWKQSIAIHIASYMEDEGYKKGSLGVFKFLTNIQDKSIDLLASSLIQLQQQSPISKEYTQCILEAIVTYKIDVAEVFHFVTNFLLDYKVQEPVRSSSYRSNQLISSSTLQSTCRKTKAREYHQGDMIKSNEVICSECNVVMLKRSYKRHRKTVHSKSEALEQTNPETIDISSPEEDFEEEKYKPRRHKRSRLPVTTENTCFQNPSDCLNQQEESDSDYYDESTQNIVQGLSRSEKSSVSPSALSSSPRRRKYLHIPAMELPSMVTQELLNFLNRKGNNLSEVNRKLITLTLKRFCFQINCRSTSAQVILNLLDQEIISRASLNAFVDTFIRTDASKKTLHNNIRNLKTILDWRISCSTGSIGDESWLRRSKGAEDLLYSLSRSWKKQTTIEAASRGQEYFIAQGSWIPWADLQKAAQEGKKQLLDIQGQFDSLNHPKVQDCLKVQSLILLQLVITCRPQRTSIYNSLKLQDWIERKPSSTGEAMLSLNSFKTSATYKNLFFSVNKYVEEMIEHFIINFRNFLVDTNSEFLFLNAKGAMIDAGSIVTDALFKITGFKTTITRIREIYRTEAAEKLSYEDTMLLDDADCHSSSTVSIYYNKIDRRSLSEKADSVFKLLQCPTEESNIDLYQNPELQTIAEK